MALFAARFLLHGNQTRAAEEAGCPKKSAAVTAARWMKHPDVIALVAQKLKKQEERLELTEDDVIRPLLRIVRHDPGAFFDEDGKPLPIAELGPNERAAIESFVATETRDKTGNVRRVVSVRKADRLRAAELLGKRLKLWTDKVETEDVTPLTDEQRAQRMAELMERARQRAAAKSGEHAA